MIILTFKFRARFTACQAWFRSTGAGRALTVVVKQVTSSPLPGGVRYGLDKVLWVAVVGRRDQVGACQARLGRVRERDIGGPDQRADIVQRAPGERVHARADSRHSSPNRQRSAPTVLKRNSSAGCV